MRNAILEPRTRAPALNAPAPIHRDLIVIGASAGALRVLLQLAAELPEGFPPVLVVQHIGRHLSVLPELLGSAGPHRAFHPVSGQKITNGTFLIAPPDHHMLVSGGEIVLTMGPKENFARPAIDPLFRSAAIAYGPRTIGVVLSGRLDDGTAGLQAIKAAGGLTVVQEPDDAKEPEMPRSALACIDVDRVTTGAMLAEVLQELVRVPITGHDDVPSAIRAEHALTLDRSNAMERIDDIGTRSDLACPECGGVLWQVNGSRPCRFRCHTGHAFSLTTLDDCQASQADVALWAALRALHERHRVLLMMLELHDADDPAVATWRLEEERVRHRIEVLRNMADDE